MPKKLMLHIGHHKTGSSYLQSVLTASIKELESEGISYQAPKAAELVAKGRTSNGNLNEFKNLMTSPEPAVSDGLPTHVFSSEDFFGQLSEVEFRAKFRDLISSGVYDRIEVLLFIRDPVSQAVSAYQQRIKGGSLTLETIAESFKRDDFPRRVNEVLNFLDEFSCISITVKNYSAVRAHLLDEFCSWLGVEKSILKLPPLSTVNRSMTASELMLLAAMSNEVGNPGVILTDALCYELPDQPADEMRPPVSEQEALWERHSADIERINARVAPEHRYDKDRDIKEPKASIENAEFSPDQVRVIAGSYAGLVLRLVNLQKSLTDTNSHILQMGERNQDLTAKLAETRERNQAMLAQIEDLRARIVKLRGPTP